MEQLNDILFYTLEKSIKSYRQFAQQQLVKNGFNITIDQWLVLKALSDNPEQTQHQIAENIFKDYASVTRIIDLLIKKEYLTRMAHQIDRRRFSLQPTSGGTALLNSMQPLIENNRATALTGISDKENAQLQHILTLITKNCKS